MKRTGDLYVRIADSENLRLAFWKAQKGKKDRQEVQEYRQQLEENLQTLRASLLNRDVPVGDYRYFTVRDPKERRICAASFRERVLHHAMMNLCEPVFERYAIHDTYACRPGKGTHRAVTRAREFGKRFRFCLKMDIAGCFDSIDHEVLMRMLARLFKDRELLNLFEHILASYQTAPGKGLPIGNLTSQHFANFYLGRLDHFVKETLRTKGYLRYMDDFLAFGNSPEELKVLLSRIRDYLDDELHLELKKGIQLKPSKAGVSFLGYRLFPDRIGLTRRSRQRFIDKLRLYEGDYLRGALPESELSRRMQSVIAFTEWADASGFRCSALSKYGVLS
jgi:retron-type reverse transcriptase